MFAQTFSWLRNLNLKKNPGFRKKKPGIYKNPGILREHRIHRRSTFGTAKKYYALFGLRRLCQYKWWPRPPLRYAPLPGGPPINRTCAFLLYPLYEEFFFVFCFLRSTNILQLLPYSSVLDRHNCIHSAACTATQLLIPNGKHLLLRGVGWCRAL